MSNERPRSVVHVVCTDAFAGVERHVAALSSGLSACGWDASVIGGNEEMGSFLEKRGLRWTPAKSMMAAAILLSHSDHPDVVHAHMTHAEMAASITKPLHRAFLVATRHFSTGRGSSLPGRVARPLIEHSLDSEIAVSSYVANSVGGSPIVIPTGICDEACHDPSSRRNVVLMVQRLEEEKATEVGLRAFAESGLAESGWSLEIAGDGAQRMILESLSKELGIERSVSFLGFVSDVPLLYRSCSMLLAPTPVEAFGLAALEAMAWGTPVVAAGAGGHLETVGQASDAALFPPGDWGTAAQLLISLARDPSLRNHYGSELRSIQRSRFRLEDQVTATAEVYGQLLSRRAER